jgi:phosphoribosylformylglycinamidine cyclo-ligase
VADSYQTAGVDQDAADALVPALARHAARARRPEVLDDLGGFAGLFSLENLAERGYRRPALACGTDGVGTKVELLRRAGLHRTAGWDAVAMCVDDVVCAGAEPLLFLDYIAIDRFDPESVEEIVAGVADACAEAGCALVGGETAQHPGMFAAPGGYDVAGTCVGVVDLDRTWGPHRVQSGDQIVGIRSSGLHANGFSLIRRLLKEGNAPPANLLAPTAIYARRLLAIRDSLDIHAAVHVTGGGIPGNLARVLPDGLGAVVHRDSWPSLEVFSWLEALGVSQDEMDRTFNLGLGMLVVTPQGAEVASALGSAAADAWVVGEARSGPGVTLA